MHRTSIPKVIGCLPAYNAEGFIEKTLSSLKKQTYTDFKILISDDCSTDNTVSIIKSVIENDDRFILIQQERNLGWVDNINFLIGKAVGLGDYLFIMPHDDFIAYNYIQKLACTLNNHPEVVLAYSDMESVFFGEKPYTLKYDHLNGISDRKKRTKILIQSTGCWGTAFRGMIRHNAANNIIPLEKSIVGRSDYALDWIWLIKLSLQGEFFRVPEVLYTKIYHINSASYLWDNKNERHITHLRSSTLNNLGLLLNCSRTLWQSPVSFQEKSIYQFAIMVLGTRRLIINNCLIVMKFIYKKTVLSIYRKQ